MGKGEGWIDGQAVIVPVVDPESNIGTPQTSMVLPVSIEWRISRLTRCMTQ